LVKLLPDYTIQLKEEFYWMAKRFKVWWEGLRYNESFFSGLYPYQNDIYQNIAVGRYQRVRQWGSC
jgi:hypothetical protein